MTSAIITKTLTDRRYFSYTYTRRGSYTRAHTHIWHTLHTTMLMSIKNKNKQLQSVSQKMKQFFAFLRNGVFSRS